ncbi:hypothetical protein [Alkaliphilus metalliredigens]|uniref:hypothetical protein n=1 Tax=Alkaliphilus metalliredigens TaxID=208226 RepID=UPI0012EE12D4|nr:hypothetical protein [Alkaliphilus metalliredigens]
MTRLKEFKFQRYHQMLLENIWIILKTRINILNTRFDGIITHDIIKEINSKRIAFVPLKIAKTNFLRVVVDAFYVEKFDILVDDIDLKDESIITIS